MPDLFGIDGAALIADAMAAAGDLREGTLTKQVNAASDFSDLLGVPAGDSTSSHTFQGFRENGARRIAGSSVVREGEFVTILAATVTPTAVPAIGDSVTLDGRVDSLLELIEEDPFSAVYVFRVEA